MMAERISRTREEILADVTVVNGHVWTTCWNCGGSGDYPSSMIPAGRCRLYCWQNRTPETFGKMPVKVEKYVKREQARDRREHKRQVAWEAQTEERARRAKAREERIASPDPRIVRAAVVFGFTVEESGHGLGFAGEMVGRWVGTGHLSDAQWDALVRATEEKEAELAKRATMTHVGTVGERLDLTLTVRGAKHLESQYGTTTLVRFEDESGNALVWFASGWRQYEDGDTCSVRATIKEHGSFNGHPQTVLTRCVVEPVESEASR
jgi:hypothetical protein